MKTVTIALAALLAVGLFGCTNTVNSKAAVVGGRVGPIAAGAGITAEGTIGVVPDSTPAPPAPPPPFALGAKLKVKTPEK